MALAGYFFNAIAALMDKFLLAGRIKTPAMYAFYVSLFSLFALVFFPFGSGFFGWFPTVVALLSGILFLYGLVALYSAVQHHEVSRISPLVGTMASVVAFGAALVPGILLKSSLPDVVLVLALILLIAGGLLISFDLPFRRGESIPFGSVVLAGLGMGCSLLLLKYAYIESDFISGLVWSRIGMFIGGISLLIIPRYRKEILQSHQETESSQSNRSFTTSAYFIVNKTCAGIGTFLVSYAAFLGPVSFVQALSGAQYFFLLLLAFPLSFRFPLIYDEKLLFWDWFQKFVAIGFIAAGLGIAAANGVTLLM